MYFEAIEVRQLTRVLITFLNLIVIELIRKLVPFLTLPLNQLLYSSSSKYNILKF